MSAALFCLPPPAPCRLRTFCYTETLMSAPTKDSLNRSNPRSTPLKRFLGFIRPYRRLLGLAALCGIARYLIPLSLPWAVKILVDDFLLAQGSRPRSQIHLLMA